ncbi:Speckle-type POZ protein-like A [Araneus ventricosus]|uniref:Speckle-type POZ protein-like A n=1 Tax=Araneus ventricosus TaxID=182803 RepID=A0A4Y2U7J2_ARAVE|nr:Speckle-type POZ protein-like A [Araneus ventricosus]
MACADYSKRKSFTFIWKLENASYCWQSNSEFIESPSFTVDEIHEINWELRLYPSTGSDNIGFYLERQDNNKGAETVAIDYELAFLASDGTALRALKRKSVEFRKGGVTGSYEFVSRNEVFTVRRSVFLPQDTLTVRCRMWKSVGEMSKDVQCFARTRIAVEKRSFLWNIENFSTLKDKKETYEIKFHGKGERLMSLELSLTGGLLCDVTRGMVSDETIRFKMIPNYQNMKMCTFQLSVVDASKNTVKCFQHEFWYRDPCGSKDFIRFCTKSELLEKKSTYLPNDVLSLRCECAFSCGSMLQEIEATNSECNVVEKKNSSNLNLDKESEFPVPICILIDNLKSMLNNSSLSDVKLKTKRQTYPAHTFILGARSPVFKCMFSSDMKEKINGCVDIEDLNDNTVLRLLRYIYSAEVGELEWASATQLYEAADKYQILSLKDVCSSHLKNSLCVNNACESLVLADRHQDEDLKVFVQDFILRHGEDIINSKEWEQLAETHLKLAYETMRLKYKEKLN